MSRSGKNNRWKHERQQKKAKAERREQKLRLRLLEDDKPIGYVSPYASERRKAERKHMYRGGGSHGGATRVAFELDIVAIATEVLGGTYYCVGRDRESNPELRANRGPERTGTEHSVTSVRGVGTPGYL